MSTTFAFVATAVKENKTTVRYSGVYMGELPEKGAELELLSLGSQKNTVKVTAVKEGGSATAKGKEKACEISVSVVKDIEDFEYSEQDVLITPYVEPEDANGAFIDNRRLEALMWKYQNDQSANTLGAISEYIAVEGNFYALAKKKKFKGKYVFPTLEGTAKRRYYPLFTNLTEIGGEQAFVDHSVLKITFAMVESWLRADITSNGIVINPWSSNMIFKRPDCGKLIRLRKQIVEMIGNESEE